MITLYAHAIAKNFRENVLITGTAPSLGSNITLAFEE